MAASVGRFGALLFAITICACDAPNKEAVMVDIGRVVASDVSPIAAPITAEPKQPTVIRDQVVYLPGMPAQRIDFPRVQNLLAQAQKDIEKSQQETFRDMRRNLLRVYEAKATIEASDYRKQSVDTTSDLLQKALADLEQAVQEYGAKRREPLSRLAFLQTQDKRRPKITEEIEEVRQVLADLDAEFERNTRSLFAAVNAARDARLTQVEAEVQRILQRWRTKAVEDAEAMTKTMAKRLKSTLAGLGSVQLPAKPGAQLHIEGAPPVQPMPSVLAPDPAKHTEARVRHDLKIWLAVKEYELVETGGRDRTNDFIEWRKRHQVAR